MVATSIAQGEYTQLSILTSTTQYNRNLAESFGIPQYAATLLYTDSESRVFMAHNPTCASRTKHIAPKCHQVRQQTNRGVVKPTHIPGADNVADMMTKALGPSLFRRFRDEAMGYANIQYPV